VDLYVQYLLGSSVGRQFDAFISGFRAVCNSPAFDVCSLSPLSFSLIPSLFPSSFSLSLSSSPILRGSLLPPINCDLQLFRWEELELLVCGSPELDFEELEKSTQYEGYDENSPVVKYLTPPPLLL